MWSADAIAGKVGAFTRLGLRSTVVIAALLSIATFGVGIAVGVLRKSDSHNAGASSELAPTVAGSRTPIPVVRSVQTIHAPGGLHGVRSARAAVSGGSTAQSASSSTTAVRSGGSSSSSSTPAASSPKRTQRSSGGAVIHQATGGGA